MRLFQTRKRSKESPLSTVRNERGAIIVFVGFAIVVMLGVGSLAVDLGRGYLQRARMARAIDAAALAGARVLREGQAVAQQHALAVAQANGVGSGVLSANLNVQFGTNAYGESWIEVTASEVVNTMMARVLGLYTMDVVSKAQAATPPVDMTLVIDHSGSLATAGAWDDLQVAANDFVAKFDDSLDQVGLVGFNTRATQRFWMQGSFTNNIQTIVNSITSAGWTNTGEALRMANEQMTLGPIRQRSAKVVVFFTDGRPTAFRGNVGIPGDEQDRVMAAGGSSVSGYWDDPMSTLPADGNPPTPDGCQGSSNCFGLWNGNQVQAQAHDDGRTWASAIRAQGVYVYTIGLGDVVTSYLQELANEGGISDATQVQGKTYIAPTAAELQAVFDLVASDIFVRLAS